jgi:hypothetical protein
MTNPNTFITRFRRKLVKLIEPMPDAGEGWCIDCTLSPGRKRTVVFPADALENHVSNHQIDEVLAIVLAR